MQRRVLFSGFATFEAHDCHVGCFFYGLIVAPFHVLLLPPCRDGTTALRRAFLMLMVHSLQRSSFHFSLCDTETEMVRAIAWTFWLV